MQGEQGKTVKDRGQCENDADDSTKLIFLANETVVCVKKVSKRIDYR